MSHGVSQNSKFSKALNLKRQFTNALNKFPWPCHLLALKQGESLTRLLLSSNESGHDFCVHHPEDTWSCSSLPLPPESTPPSRNGTGRGEHASVLHQVERAVHTLLLVSYCQYSTYGKWTQTSHVYPNILTGRCVDLAYYEDKYFCWKYLAGHFVLPEPGISKTQWYYC